jgi:segregation and condensation protein A
VDEIISRDFEEYPHFFEVKLQEFDGPVDLLLHLVKSRELPIEKVSLAAVTEQYLACISRVKSFDLEIAGEYLVIAATLLSIKSSLLLGAPVQLIEDESGNLINPHDELLARLREAAIYKEGARILSEAPQLDRDVFAASRGHLRAVPATVRFVDHDPMLLGKAFYRILQEAEGLDIRTYEVTLDSVSIVDRMMRVMERVADAKAGVSFRSLIPDIRDRSEIVGVFVALLELCKRQAIRVRQADASEEILIFASGTQVQASEMVSEFDTEESYDADSDFQDLTANS